MKSIKHIFLIVSLAITTCVFGQLPMGQWKMHNPFTQVTQIAQGNNLIFGITEGTLFSVDKNDMELQYYSKVTGLTGTNIKQIAYSKELDKLIIIYADGKIDLLTEDGDVESIFDLYLSEINYSKQPNSITLQGHYAYLATEFGVLAINLRKKEIADTYSVTQQDEQQAIISVVLTNDTIFALTKDNIYSAYLKNNLLDFASWQSVSDLPTQSNFKKISNHSNDIYLLAGNQLFCRTNERNNEWKCVSDTIKVSDFEIEGDSIYIYSDPNTYTIDKNDKLNLLKLPNMVYGTTLDNFHNTYWFALGGYGVGRLEKNTNNLSYIYPVGPCSNTPYRIRCQEGATYIVPGGYFTSGTGAEGALMIYKNGTWYNYNTGFFAEQLDGFVPHNFDNVIVEPNHPEHFFISSFGNGLFEFKNDKLVKWHTPLNSGLDSKIEDRPTAYTWVDGLRYDSKGNLYMLNNSPAGVKILDPKGNWHSISNQATNELDRSKDLLISSLNENIKITMSIRSNTGVGVFDDNGTPFYEQDDRAVLRQVFIDEDNKEIHPDNIYSINQDKNGVLWVCTNAGLFLVDNPATLLDNNHCRRIKISRNDGTTLADYLLNDERVNCITFDGTNRRWIGTANSGLYLLKETEDYGMEIYHHFTTDNSPLPSNNIIALDIDPRTGEVMIGTAEGFITYQSDAADSAEDYSDVYAYPNPVRPDYDGQIAIMGLTDGSFVKITDAAGNLVCQTVSKGSIAVWDGRDYSGRHVRSGVYTAQIVSADGKEHKLTKILVMY